MNTAWGPTSACAKFILGGEHSVVHRGRALAFPVKKLRLEAVESSTPGLCINGRAFADEHWQRVLELRRRLGARSDIQGLDLRSEIPIAAGLGSSAALCVSVARQIALTEGQNPTRTQVAEAAWEGEKIFHGNSSGIDPYTVALEEPILYRSSDHSWRALDLRRFEKSGLRFVLQSSGLRHKSGDVIHAVTSLREQTPLIFEDLMDALATNAESMVRALEEEPLGLGRLMNDTQFRLAQLGVSCAAIDATVDRMKTAGALGAKLTGSGKGGFVLGLFREDDARAYAAQMAAAPKPAGFEDEVQVCVWES